jgi:hypothetical protein
MVNPAIKVGESFHKILMGIMEFDLAEENEKIEREDGKEQIDLLNDGKAKVDGYKWLLDQLELHAAFMKKRKQEYEACEKSLNSHINRIQGNLLYALKANGFDRFTGNEFIVVQKPSNKQAVEIKGGAPTIDHAIKYSDFVNTSYSWDKVAIGNVLKETSDSPISEVAKLTRSVKAEFIINSEAKAKKKHDDGSKTNG